MLSEEIQQIHRKHFRGYRKGHLVKNFTARQINRNLGNISFFNRRRCGFSVELNIFKIVTHSLKKTDPRTGYRSAKTFWISITTGTPAVTPAAPSSLIVGRQSVPPWAWDWTVCRLRPGTFFRPRPGTWGKFTAVWASRRPPGFSTAWER